MAKKTSGLGRGLGELLEDNTPTVRQGQGSAIRIEAKPPVTEAPVPTVSAAVSAVPPAPKPLYAEIHKNKSLKANFKNFKR